MIIGIRIAEEGNPLTSFKIPAPQFRGVFFGPLNHASLPLQNLKRKG